MSGETETAPEGKGVTILTADEQARVELVREQHEWARDLTPVQWRALLDLGADLSQSRPKVTTRVTHDSIGFDVERTPEDEARATAINAQLREQAEKDTWTGDRHDPTRTPQELARIIRADIAGAVRAGAIPEQRYVVSVDRRNAIRITTAAYRAFRDAGRPDDGGPLGYRVDWTLAGKIGALIKPFNRGFPSWDFDSGEMFYSVRFNDGLAKDRV